MNCSISFFLLQSSQLLLDQCVLDFLFLFILVVVDNKDDNYDDEQDDGDDPQNPFDDGDCFAKIV
jgi:hypothetical protein